MDIGNNWRCHLLTGFIFFLQVQVFLAKAQEQVSLLSSSSSSSGGGYIDTSNSSSKTRRELLGGCDLFKGRWVVDNSYPLYSPSGCPYIDPGYDCLKHGRPDTHYLKYAWHPDSCNLPRFNGLDLLSKWRGKKVMFVGDSLSENMWQSLACLLHASAPRSQTSFHQKSPLTSLTFQVCPLLAEELDLIYKGAEGPRINIVSRENLILKENP